MNWAVPSITIVARPVRPSLMNDHRPSGAA
jgi:hypothetical protein